MQPLRDAIKQKYGVSDEVSNQVISALAQVERHRQSTSGAEVQGFRARTPSDGMPQGGSGSMPDIGTIIDRTTNNRSMSNRSGGSSSGLIGIIISLVMFVINMLMQRRASQTGSRSNSPVTSILDDLLGGARTPNQAPDLGSILGTLLGGSTGTGGPGAQRSNQSLDLDDILRTVMNQPEPDSRPLTRPRSR